MEASVYVDPRLKRIQAPSPLPDQRVARLLSTTLAGTLPSLVLAVTALPATGISKIPPGTGVGVRVGVGVTGAPVAVGVGVGVPAVPFTTWSIAVRSDVLPVVSPDSSQIMIP